MCLRDRWSDASEGAAHTQDVVPRGEEDVDVSGLMSYCDCCTVYSTDMHSYLSYWLRHSVMPPGNMAPQCKVQHVAQWP